RSHTNREASALLSELETTGTVESSPEISLAGRVTAARHMGKMSFLDLRDGSGRIQASFRSDVAGPEVFQFVRDLDLGDFIGVSGKLFRTRTNEPTVQATSCVLLAKSLQPLPEKWHGLSDTEKRYRQRYLDLICSEDCRSVFQQRSSIISSLRSFMCDNGYCEVETPVLQPQPGGALARPFVTHHHSLDQDLYLRIALELYLKRLIIGGMDKVFEIGRVFRNEGIDTTHNPEFTMMESYAAYSDYNDVMSFVEAMVSHVSTGAIGTNKLKFGENEIDLTPPWKRVSLRQAVSEGSGIDFEDYSDADSLRERMRRLGMAVDPTKGRGRLIDELISTFVEPKLVQPTFLYDYPLDMSPLAKKKPGSETIVERFEGFVATMELANAFSELNDPLDQRARFEKQMAEHRQGDLEAIAEVADEDFLHAMEYGMPPTGGLGIGIDRLVMLLTNKQSIREVVLFPQLRTK
ncbi:MAG: lysine--tRNA ligase, partial [Chloroflexi bacterium]|nr:lysine--tRNA ligase [Chloroflexota bacterium]